ncbi:MAG TPA: SDR family NAD(P)-dependent oxidoreductase [Ktedonobacteraceae bacterium]|jgi:NADP-dependent 3-hydroxy acid dehydrogenase YdfG
MKLQNGIVAVVTGAGSGIGRALAQELAQRQCALALADIDAAGLDETAQLTGAAALTTHVLDVADRSAVAQFASAVIEEHGRVNLLINNAGVALGGSVEQLALDNMAWLFNINFWGMVYGVKYFLPILQQQPEAHIVNLSSVFGLFAPAGQSAYAASKFAVRGFSEALARELAASSVRVSCVHPAGIKTNIAVRARVDDLPAEKRAQAGEAFVRVLRLSPQYAAQVILRGVEANRARILVGRQAYWIDRIVRLAPVRGPALLQRLSMRLLRM